MQTCLDIRSVFGVLLFRMIHRMYPGIRSFKRLFELLRFCAFTANLDLAFALACIALPSCHPIRRAVRLKLLERHRATVGYYALQNFVEQNSYLYEADNWCTYAS